MCLTCGCHEPSDDHDDKRNITLHDMQDAAQAAHISVEQAARNIDDCLPGQTNKARRSLTLTYVDFPIEKSETLDDGSVVVWGPCTTDDVDSDRQVVDAEFASSGLSKWLATGGNIREMHQPKAIGLGIELQREGNQHWLRSRIVEPVAAKLAQEKVLRAYSVGIANAQLDYTKNPKARGGTIVGGEFVEVSLVDRPANASCKVDLVKAAKDGSAEFCDTLTKDKLDADARHALSDSDFAYIDKTGDRHLPIEDEGHVHSALGRFSQTHFDSDADKKKAAKKILAAAKKFGVDVDPTSTVAQAAKSRTVKAAVPEVDQEVTDDLEAADEAVHEAQDAQEEDNEAHREGKPEKVEIPYTLKRFHDHTCAAYSSEAVGEEYPTCASVLDALDVSYWQKAISTALTEDAGSGRLARTMTILSDAYGQAVQLRSSPPDAVADAQAFMRKAFRDMYPDVTVKPSTVTPGRFCRPFIASGRAGMHATAHPRLPMQAHVPDASDFERGYLSAGHAADSPCAGPPNGPRSEKNKKADKRQFYTNNARDQACEAMMTLHDYIVATHPEVCPMGLEPATPAPNDGGRVDNQSHASPKPVAMKGTLNLEDAEVDIATLKTMIAKVASKKAKKATGKLAKKNKKLTKKLAKVAKANDELTKLADPSAMAYRGGKIGPAVTKEAAPEAPGDSKQDEIDWLKGQVRHPDIAVSRPAMDKLQGMVSPDELADILTR